MMLNINALRFAFAFAGTAIGTFVCIDCDTEEAVLGQQSEDRADRADVVAPGATVYECPDTDADKEKER